MVYVVYNGETCNGNDVSIELFNNKSVAENRLKELQDEIGDNEDYFVYMEKISIQ